MQTALQVARETLLLQEGHTDTLVNFPGLEMEPRAKTVQAFVQSLLGDRFKWPEHIKEPPVTSGEDDPVPTKELKSQLPPTRAQSEHWFRTLATLQGWSEQQRVEGRNRLAQDPKGYIPTHQTHLLGKQKRCLQHPHSAQVLT